MEEHAGPFTQDSSLKRDSAPLPRSLGRVSELRALCGEGLGPDCRAKL